MEELGMHKARDNWCMWVEQQLGCSTEHSLGDALPGLLRVCKLENEILNIVSLWSAFLFSTDRFQIIPATLSKIYVFAGIIPANPCDPIAQAASSLIVNDLLVNAVLCEEGMDVQVLFSNLELGVWYIYSFHEYLKYIWLGCTRNHLCKQAGEQPLLKGDRLSFTTTFKSRKKATVSEIDRFNVSNKPSHWCNMELEASQAMEALLKQAPVQSGVLKDTANQLPEPWWQFAHLLLHHDPGLNKLPVEHDQITCTFCDHVLLMTHNPVCKNGSRVVALIDGKSDIAKFSSILTCHSSCNPGERINSVPSCADWI